jgi:cysteine desulfurase/selenocysteine lyase
VFNDNDFLEDLVINKKEILQKDLSRCALDVIKKNQIDVSEIKKLEGLKIYGTAEEKTSVISFNIDGINPYDIGTIVDKLGIAVRTGHHCAQPIMNFFEIPGTIRASFAFYNTKEEIDSMIEAVKKAKMMLS